MKNNDIQELKPIYIHEASYSTNNEVSLVYLAMVLVRHRILIAAIVIITIAAGATSALLKPRTYTVNTTIEIGSQLLGNNAENFESPQSVLAKLEYSYIPQTLNAYRATNPNDATVYQIIASTPAGSALIVLEMNGTKNQNDLMNTLSMRTATTIIQDHNKFYNIIKQNIITSLKLFESELTRLNSQKDVEAEKIQLLQNKVESYNLQQANLRNTQIISPPTISVEPTGGSRKPIVMIAAFAGIFLAVFAAFFVEFVAKVKKASSQQSVDP